MIGIYAAINTQTRARYIGASMFLESRLHRHYLQLTAGKHPNKALQIDWDAYGADAFAFEILEVVNMANDLALAELMHIKLALADGDRLYNSPRGNLYTGSVYNRNDGVDTYRPRL
jgi:group I intron endonuclease